MRNLHTNHLPPCLCVLRVRDFRSCSKENTFFAFFPVVLRPWKKKDYVVKAGHKRHLSDIIKGEDRAEYSGFVTAEDKNGCAAILGLGDQKDTLLLARDDALGCRCELKKI